MASDIAMSVKARSLFSKHLTVEEFHLMSQFKTVSEIASFLQTKDRYREVLMSLSNQEVHREELEKQIRRMGINDFLKLMRYVKEGDNSFFNYYIKRREIELILYVLQAIRSNSEHKADTYMKLMQQYMEISIDRIIQSKSYRELQNYLITTSYGHLLDNLYDENPDLSETEDKLNDYYRIVLRKLVADSNRIELLSIFNMDDELKTVGHIYRLKKYYNVPAEDIISRLNYIPYFIPKHRMINWTESYDADELIDAFKNTAYGRYITSENFETIETYLNSVRSKFAKHQLRFAKDTNTVLASYMMLVHLEIDNIIDIIEGVRYQIKPDSIMNLITQ